MMKVSEWLREHVSSHAIQDAVKLQASYEAETGKKDTLPSHTVKEARKAIAARGLGGTCAGQDKDRVTYGYDLAYFLATRYGDPKHTRYREVMGRGTLFYAALESIEAAGN